MIEKIVVDTDVIIDHLRGVDKATSFLKDVEAKRYKAFISTITEAELFSGNKMTSEEETKIKKLLTIFNKIDVDSSIAYKAGWFRRTYHCSLPDAIIAATSYVNDRIKIVTRNIKHFEAIKEIKCFQPY